MWNEELPLCQKKKNKKLVRILGYRSGGPSSIPGTTRKEK
jgi:hypothetical protein